MRYALCRYVAPLCEVVATVGDGRELVEAAERERPDLILADISLPIISGISAARRIRQLDASVKIIFVTGHTDPIYIQEAFSLGGQGYVLKDSAPQELSEAIRTVLAGETYRSLRLA
jgi:DNA-binding NarL/FixJ family response regulator